MWLAVLSGLLLAASQPPHWVLPALFFGFVPLLIAISAGPPIGATLRALRLGTVTGLVYFALLLHWLPFALADRPLLGLAASTLLIGALASSVGLFALAVHWIVARRPRWLPIAAAATWPAVEWLVASAGPFAFPAMTAQPLLQLPQLAGAADLVGATGLTLLVSLVNGLIARGVLRREDASARLFGVRHFAAAGGVVLAMGVYGVARDATMRTTEAVRIAAIRSDIRQEVRRERDDAAQLSLAALTDETRDFQRTQPDLVVWPEIALPLDLEAPDQAPTRTMLEALAREIGTPILLGAWGRSGSKRYNSAFIADGEGRTNRVHDKSLLVPFVERVPLNGIERFGGRMHYGGMSPGRGPGAVTLGEHRFGVLICFESALSGPARTLRRDGATWLVAISNDAWFASNRWDGAENAAVQQHLAQLRLRAIETRSGIARSANGGPALAVDASGRVHRAAPYGPSGLLELRSAAVAPPFVRLGDVVGPGTLLLTIALLLGAGAAQRRPLENGPLRYYTSQARARSHEIHQHR